jgi:hypothetical protein
MKKIFWMLPLAILLVIQFIRPNVQNKAVDPALDFSAMMNVPADLQQVLSDACYDCHSNTAKFPWYSQVAPVSWWIANHINEGRENLNFSEFGAIAANDRTEVMEELEEVLVEGEMPLASYTWLHPEARLSEAQKTALLDWVKTNRGQAGNTTRENDHNDEGDQESDEKE